MIWKKKRDVINASMKRVFPPLMLREEVFSWTFLGTMSKEHLVYVLWLSSLKKDSTQAALEKRVAKLEF